MNATPQQDSLQLQVDPEHNGVRLGMVSLFVGILVITFLIGNTLIQSNGFNILAGILAFGLAAIVTRFADPMVKRLLPSKRILSLNANGATLTKNDKPETSINADATANTYYWKFKIPRRGRMPRGWFVIACALHQDDNYIAVYTFASPAKTEWLSKLKPFTELLSEKKASAANVDSLRLAGEQRRLRVAEEHRWHDGGELTVEDFESFIKRLNELYVRWNT